MHIYFPLPSYHNINDKKQFNNCGAIPQVINGFAIIEGQKKQEKYFFSCREGREYLKNTENELLEK